MVPPTRRRVLASLAGLGALAGCSAFPGDDRSGGPGRTATVETTPTALPTPVATPGRPADLADDEAVARYVRDYEYALVHNGAVNGDRTVTSVQVSCEGATSARTDAGVVAYAGCSGGISYADGSHADLGSIPAPYYVAADRTVRLDGYDAGAVRDRPPGEVFAAEDPAENVAPPDGSTRGFAVHNLDDAERRVAVAVRYLGEWPSTGTESPTATESVAGGGSPTATESAAGGGSPTATESAVDDGPLAFEATYDLAPRSTVIQNDVAVREGEYRVEARLAAGPAASYRWRLTGFSGPLEPAVAVTPEPDVAVGPVGV